MASCNLYGASPIMRTVPRVNRKGQYLDATGKVVSSPNKAARVRKPSGLCRANPGTAYGPKKGRTGAVITGTGTIVPDPKLPHNKQPWSKFFGEKLWSCDSRRGYYEIADSGPKGATFNKHSANVVRKFPNMSQGRVFFSAHAGRAGTLCIKADQPSIREGIIRKINGDMPWYVRYTPLRLFMGDAGECPKGLTDKQCTALATSMENLRPPSQNHFVEFFFLLAAFTIGPDVYHALKRWIQSKRNGGDGDGKGNGGGGGDSITFEQLGQILAGVAAAQGEPAKAPQATEPKTFVANSLIHGMLQYGGAKAIRSTTAGQVPVAKGLPAGKAGVKPTTIAPPVPIVAAPRPFAVRAPVFVPRAAPVPVVP